jgi:hypothetical protein
MEKLERVIYDLERCTCHVPDACRDCSKYASETGLKCMENLMMDALELLKEQEPVKLRFIDGKRNHFVKCGNCNFDLMHGMKFCPHCGRAVKWDDI